MALERNRKPNSERETVPTLMGAVQAAMNLAVSGRTNENIVQTFNGVTVTIPGYNPLAITYRYLNERGDITSYTFSAFVNSGKEALEHKYDQALEHAVSGDFPTMVSELLLEHAGAIRWFFDHYEHLGRGIRR